MSTTLHEAIAAVRAGEMARAQLLAADIVRENPDDPNGWYLLSQLVDSDARRAAYLGKTLALDPNHARARIEFDSLPPALVADLMPAGAATVAETVAEAETAVYAVGEDTPEWLADPAAEAEAVIAPTTELSEVVEVTGEAVPADVPDWLQPLDPKPAPPSSHLTPAQPGITQPQPAAARKSAPAKKKNSGNQALSILLGLLLVLTVLVVAFLVYLLVF